jgi:hypothetical protein
VGWHVRAGESGTVNSDHRRADAYPDRGPRKASIAARAGAAASRVAREGLSPAGEAARRSAYDPWSPARLRAGGWWPLAQ